MRISSQKEIYGIGMPESGFRNRKSGIGVLEIEFHDLQCRNRDTGKRFLLTIPSGKAKMALSESHNDQGKDDRPRPMHSFKSPTDERKGSHWTS